ncbi:MAG TPA: hypothetical protein VFB95_12395 [Candidatus Cryosericum sp.]|nr:hypothetical protein [Candidatus Cryosericum sp.]
MEAVGSHAPVAADGRHLGDTGLVPAVYEGTLGAPFTTHAPVTCRAGGATSWTFTPGPGDRYYYVVPRNAVSEGSYGLTSALLPRPPSTAACLPQEVLSSCG